MGAVRCANTATVPGKELIAWLKVPAVGVVAVGAGLIASLAKAVAIWHHTGLLTILLHELEQIRASRVFGELLKLWHFSWLLLELFVPFLVLELSLFGIFRSFLVLALLLFSFRLFLSSLFLPFLVLCLLILTPELIEQARIRLIDFLIKLVD